jgi:hypothetical protein
LRRTLFACALVCVFGIGCSKLPEREAVDPEAARQEQIKLNEARAKERSGK